MKAKSNETSGRVISHISARWKRITCLGRKPTGLISAALITAGPDGGAQFEQMYSILFKETRRKPPIMCASDTHDSQSAVAAATLK